MTVRNSLIIHHSTSLVVDYLVNRLIIVAALITAQNTSKVLCEVQHFTYIQGH